MCYSLERPRQGLLEEHPACGEMKNNNQGTH